MFILCFYSIFYDVLLNAKQTHQSNGLSRSSRLNRLFTVFTINTLINNITKEKRLSLTSVFWNKTQLAIPSAVSNSLICASCCPKKAVNAAASL